MNCLRAKKQFIRILSPCLMLAVTWFFAFSCCNAFLSGLYINDKPIHKNHLVSIKYGSDCLTDNTDVFGANHDSAPADICLTAINYSMFYYHIIKNDTALSIKNNIILNLRI